MLKLSPFYKYSPRYTGDYADAYKTLATLLSSPLGSVVGTLTAAMSHLPLEDQVRTQQPTVLQGGKQTCQLWPSIRDSAEHRVP